MAKEAAIEEVADSKSRQLLAYEESSNRTDAATGDSVLFYETEIRKTAPRRRGMAKILDTDESGVTVKFRNQTFQVTRYCARKTMEERMCVGWDGTLPGD